MDDKLFKRVSYENLLMGFFNDYCDLAQFAMTTGSVKTKDGYLNMQDALKSAADYSRNLIRQIPEEEDNNFKKDNKAFLNLIACRLENIAERYKHLEAKSLDGEKYSFFQDREYIKKDRAFEKEISKLGILMNRYKEETKRMLDS